MYIPQHFKEPRTDLLQAMMQKHPLATIVICDESGLSADHIPLTFRPDGSPHGMLLGHVARANPLWKKAASGIDCLAVFQGVQGYISPNGYATKAATGKVVPTWNYEVVHATGRLQAVDDAEWLRGFLGELTAEHEQSQPTAWRIDDAPPDYIDRMLQAVVGIQIEITGLVGKLKLSQNQPAENKQSLLQALQAAGNAQSADMAAAVRRQIRDGA